MKKLISLLLALVMVLSLAACGGDSKTPDSGSKTPAVMTAAAAPLTAANWNTWIFPWVTGM